MTGGVEVDDVNVGGGGCPNYKGFVEVTAAVDDVAEVAVVESGARPVGDDSQRRPRLWKSWMPLVLRVKALWSRTIWSRVMLKLVRVSPIAPEDSLGDGGAYWCWLGIDRWFR